MTDEITDVTAEPLFKANKRRKVIRRRHQDDDQESGAPAVSAQQQDSVDDEKVAGPAIVRRPVAKKHGVGFSSSGAAKTSTGGEPTETALVPAQPGRLEEAVQSERFVKPTGKVVVEDKHLTAYVDSKLAELRSSTATPNQDGTPTTSSTANIGLSEATATDLDLSPGKTSAVPTNESQRRFSTRKPRRRRQPFQRGEDALARDAMVDQIMRESDMPIYDRTTNNAPLPTTAEGGEEDADEAAAQAFKAEFLANLASRKRRKPPAAPTNSSKPGAQQAAPSGPKLGGSRAQRERMKALEEAKRKA